MIVIKGLLLSIFLFIFGIYIDILSFLLKKLTKKKSDLSKTYFIILSLLFENSIKIWQHKEKELIKILK